MSEEIAASGSLDTFEIVTTYAGIEIQAPPDYRYKPHGVWRLRDLFPGKDTWHWLISQGGTRLLGVRCTVDGDVTERSQDYTPVRVLSAIYSLLVTPIRGMDDAPGQLVLREAFRIALDDLRDGWPGSSKGGPAG